MNSSSRLLPCAVAMAAMAGCFLPPSDDGAAPTGGSASSSAGAGSTGAGGAGNPGAGGPAGSAGDGLPCNVDALLAMRCRSCHGSPPSAPMPLLSYEDLAAFAVSDPSRSVAELAVERMESPSAPMPPGNGPTVPKAERDAFRAWVEAGLPKGECGGGGSGGSGGSGGADPGPIETVCTSQLHWSGETDDLDEEGPWMNPGRPCIKCHLAKKGKSIVRLGGTVYPTLREPDLCYGVDGDTSDAHVVVTDFSGATFTMQLEKTGNFSLPMNDGPVDFPITAKVVAGGKVREMTTPQASGDCNGCHTEQGKNGAPGRIFLP